MRKLTFDEFNNVTMQNDNIYIVIFIYDLIQKQTFHCVLQRIM